MTTPLISVLMTAYNREKYIAEAIESVLASSYRNFELIIVDDGSGDRTVEIAKSFETRDPRVKVYVNEKNLGDYPNRNRAASYANGKYIKYLDSDDYLYPHGLEVMVSFMERFPEAGFGIMSRGDYESPYPKMLSPKQTFLEHFNGYGHLNRAPGSGIINLRIFRELGGFSGRNVIGDVEFWFDIARTYPMVKIVDDLYWPRTHGNQQKDTVTTIKYADMRQEIVEKAFAHPGCPLTAEEILQVRKKIKKSSRRDRLFLFLSGVRKGLTK
jgi:glycosyltransferase involved in cell wall biosynthesis